MIESGPAERGRSRATDDRSRGSITLRFLAAPSEVSVDGASVPAGRVLEWIDKAGYACAVGWAASYCVTAYVGNIHFTSPIRTGELIEVHARIMLTGTSSMHILVTVVASNIQTRQFRPAMHCILVFVAVDDHGKPLPVEPWRPRTLPEFELEQLARDRIEPRRTIQATMAAQEYTDAGTTPRTTFRFLAAPSDANWGGNVHGGTVMRWIDETAFACAASWSSANAVAVYAGGIQFHQPIHIGDLVQVDARMIHTGFHSMHISVQVRSALPTSPDDLTLKTRAMSIFVHIGENRRSADVRQLNLRSSEDLQLHAHAAELSQLRVAMPAIPADFSDR